MKKLYIQPETMSHRISFTGNLCVGSIQNNLDLNYTGLSDEDPI